MINWKKIIGVCILLTFLSVSGLAGCCQCDHGCKDTSITEHQHSIWFRSCSEFDHSDEDYSCSGNDIAACPENNYMKKLTFSGTTCCTEIGSGCGETTTMDVEGNQVEVVECTGDPCGCGEWTSYGATGDPTISNTCGAGTNAWNCVDASDWGCEPCKELALWYGGDTSELDNALEWSGFDSITPKDENAFYRTDETMSWQFQGTIPACQNRIPLVNLHVQADDMDSLYGVYAKHKTLEYDDDSPGELDQFKTPNLSDQDNFKKTYAITATFNAYRPWGWRKRLKEAIENKASSMSLPSGTQMSEGRYGDLYISSDFEIGDLPGGSTDCTVEVNRDFSCSEDVLHNIDVSGTCTVDDLNNKPLSQIETAVRDICDVPSSYEINDVTATEQDNVEFTSEEISMDDVDLVDHGYDNSKQFDGWWSNPDLQSLLDHGVVTDSSLSTACENNDNWHDFFNSGFLGCNNYEPTFDSYSGERIRVRPESEDADKDVDFSVDFDYEYEDDFDNFSDFKQDAETWDFSEWDDRFYLDWELYDGCKDAAENSYTDFNYPRDYCYDESLTQAHITKIDDEEAEVVLDIEATADVTLWRDADVEVEAECEWDNDVFADIDIGSSQTYPCEQKWDWGSLAEIDSSTLANCLYNYDECIMDSRDGGSYREVADCGIGQPSSLLDTSLKDAARGTNVYNRDITVYRECSEIGGKWVENIPAPVYACATDDSDLASVDKNYETDVTELDEQRVVWKCGYALSSDEDNFTDQKSVGTMLDFDSPREGTTDWICAYTDSYAWVTDDKPEITIDDPSRPVELDRPSKENKVINFTIFDEVDVNESTVTVRVNGTSWNGYYNEYSETFNGSEHCENWGLDPTQDEDKSRYIDCSYKEPLIKPGVMTVTICAEDNPRHKRNCVNRTFKYLANVSIGNLCYRWNAISLPAVPINVTTGAEDTDPATSQVFDDVPYDRITRYESGEVFDAYAPEIPEGVAQSISELEVGKGYYLFVTKESNAYPSCFNTSYWGIPDPDCEDRQLTDEGLYFFGIQKNSTMLNEDIQNVLSGMSYKGPYYYTKSVNVPYGKFLQYPDYTEFETGKGYWLNYTGSGGEELDICGDGTP